MGYTNRDRVKDSRWVADQIIALIKQLYDTTQLPFDACVCPPAHKEKPIDLADFICQRISGGSVTYLKGLVRDRDSHQSALGIPKSERLGVLSDGFVVSPPANFTPKKGILLVDDIFDTGATLKGVSNAIALLYPDLPRYAITATYIGHMGKIQAL
jgi:predicted amidophosphoribosyltransferase